MVGTLTADQRLTRRRSVTVGLTRPATIAALSFALAVGYVLLRLGLHGWDMSYFVVAGDTFNDPTKVPAELHLQHNSSGYDGQFFYHLAHDPFTNRATSHGMTLDQPSYRQQRILFPLAVWLLTHLGLSVGWGLIVVNVLAIAVVGWAAASLAGDLGRAPAWGLLFALSPTLIVGLARDLAEPTAWAAVLVGLLLWLRHRPWWAAVFFSAAVLARETALLVPAGLGIVALWRWFTAPGRERRTHAVRIAALVAGPLATFLLWQAWLLHQWGRLPANPSEDGLGVPFAGVLRSLTGSALPPYVVSSNPPGMLHIWTAERFVLLVFLAYVAATLATSGAAADIKVAWLGALVLGFSVPAWLWESQFVRHTGEAILLGMLVLLGCRGARGRVGLELMGLLSVAVGLTFAGIV